MFAHAWLLHEPGATADIVTVITSRDALIATLLDLTDHVLASLLQTT